MSDNGTGTPRCECGHEQDRHIDIAHDRFRVDRDCHDCDCPGYRPAEQPDEREGMVNWLRTKMQDGNDFILCDKDARGACQDCLDNIRKTGEAVEATLSELAAREAEAAELRENWRSDAVRGALHDVICYGVDITSGVSDNPKHTAQKLIDRASDALRLIEGKEAKGDGE